MQIFLVFLAAYLIGAIPFGVIAAKLCGKDIFKIGSGSTGSTNVIRACGPKWGIAVLLLDVLKGALATYLGVIFFANPWLTVSCGILAMLGHSYSVFIRFKGGKSAAAGIGIIMILNWQIFLIVALATLIIRQISGYQSLATLLGSLLTVVLFFVLNQPLAYGTIVLLGTVFVWYKHIPNIQRLLKGTESRIVKEGKK